MSQALLTVLSGARTPRVDIVPPYAYSYGDLGIALMAKAGRPLDDWQGDGLTGMLGCKANGEYAAFEWAEWVPRQNGKGGTLEGRTLTGFLVLEEELIMWSAHEYRTAMEAFRRLKGLIRALSAEQINKWIWSIQDPEISPTEIRIKILDSHGSEGFERLDNGQRIQFIARSKQAGRGFSGNLNILDESFAYDIRMQDALMPTLGAAHNPQFVYTSSPPLRGDTAEPMYALRERAERLLGVLEKEGPEAFRRECAEESLGYRDYGLGGDLDNLEIFDLDDVRNYAKANPALGIRKPLQRIMKFHRSMSAVGFAREELGIWPRQLTAGGVIDPRQWGRLKDEESVREGPLTIGVRISPLRDYSAVCVYGVRPDGLGHLALSDYRAGTAWIVDRLREIQDEHDVLSVAMPRATYASLRTELEAAGFQVPEGDEPEFGQLHVLTGPDMAAACGQLIDAVRQSSFKHRGNAELDASVSTSQARPSGDGIVWEERNAESDAAPLTAATVARYGYQARAHLITPYDVLSTVGRAEGQCESCDAWPADGCSIKHYDDCGDHPGEVTYL